MADENVNCGILNLETLFSCFLWEDREGVMGETLRRNNLKCFTVSGVVFWFPIPFSPFPFLFVLDMTPAFYFLYQNRNVFGTMILNPKSAEIQRTIKE